MATSRIQFIDTARLNNGGTANKNKLPNHALLSERSLTPMAYNADIGHGATQLGVAGSWPAHKADGSPRLRIAALCNATLAKPIDRSASQCISFMQSKTGMRHQMMAEAAESLLYELDSWR